MNSLSVFTEFAKAAQADDQYYTWGKPTQIGMIEDVLAYFGVNYVITGHSKVMHQDNLERLRDFLLNHASESQIMMVHDITARGDSVPNIDIGLDSAGKVFVSMPMDQEKCSDVAVIHDGIQRGIKETGNTPYFLNLDAHNGNITVKMLDEIRACKFLVADFTTQNNGVYYEAGFATGIGKTVIHTCKQSDFMDRHFDISQMQTLVWTSKDELAQKLKAQILGSNLGGK